MNNKVNFLSILMQRPLAVAKVRGSKDYPDIRGSVTFRTAKIGIMVVAEVIGLPLEGDVCQSPVFAFHIHEGESCSGDETDYFKDAGLHYNPLLCPHPYHAGDMPPLFGVKKTAFCAFLTDRFSIGEIIGKTVIIHAHSDDFMLQPSGNAGTKMACGVIERF